MSLGIAIKSPSGIVLAAESRVTLQTDSPILGHPLYISYDNAVKLFGLGVEPHQHVGIVTWGQAAIGLRTAHSYLPELQSHLPDERLSIKAYSERIGHFFVERWNEQLGNQQYVGQPMTMIIAGYDDKKAYGEVYELNLPHSANPIARHDANQFGLTWGGQREYVDRLVRGYDHRVVELMRESGIAEENIDAFQAKAAAIQMKVPVQALPLEDCVDLALFFIRTTIAAQRLSVVMRGCGGPIDVATLTRSEGLSFVQEKRIRGEVPDGTPHLFPS